MPISVSESSNVRRPDVRQVWAIGWPDAAGQMQLLPPIDDDGVECFMAFPTRDDAERAMRRQVEKGYLEGENEPQVVLLFDSGK